MACNIYACTGIVAPYYNLAMLIIVVILFAYLLKTPNKKKVFMAPWKYLFFAIMVFSLEEIMTVLGAAGILRFPQFIFGIFEMIMISLFIYMVLLQKENIKK